MTWSFDMSTAPRDCRIWLATKCDRVSVTYWDKKREQWSGIADREVPLAWQAYVIPAHPGARAAVSHDINLPIIEDCGSGA